MIKRRVVAAALGAMLVLPIFAVPVAAGTPTEINVTPYSQIRDGCPSVSANWTVYLSGGTSGNYAVNVTYGDGSHAPTTYTNDTSGINWGKTYATNCSQARNFHQYWTASRTGGGTGTDDSWVLTN